MNQVEAAGELVARLGERGWTLSTAESLTGGALSSAIVSIPGASKVFLGGFVAYATPIKHALLGVDLGLLERHGPVHADVALAMATGACRLTGANVSIATTGVAGPDKQDGQPVGRVHMAIVTPDDHATLTKDFTGNREAIRVSSVETALAMALSVLDRH
ncbi:MAG: CinA family protein [Actinomycetaceae bacterium]|nr:CinA family protein [Actinomycetaceae bacterium]